MAACSARSRSSLDMPAAARTASTVISCGKSPSNDRFSTLTQECSGRPLLSTSPTARRGCWPAAWAARTARIIRHAIKHSAAVGKGSVSSASPIADPSSCPDWPLKTSPPSSPGMRPASRRPGTGASPAPGLRGARRTLRSPARSTGAFTAPLPSVQVRSSPGTSRGRYQTNRQPDIWRRQPRLPTHGQRRWAVCRVHRLPRTGGRLEPASLEVDQRRWTRSQSSVNGRRTVSATRTTPVPPSRR